MITTLTLVCISNQPNAPQTVKLLPRNKERHKMLHKITRKAGNRIVTPPEKAYT